MQDSKIRAILIVIGAVVGIVIAQFFSGTAVATIGPSVQGGDALWHLPKFGEQGWFIHAHNGQVRACNMDKTSVVGNRQGPRCSNWQ